MKVNLDKFDILIWMEGCIIGSHLRQKIWSRAIDEFYEKLSDSERNFIFHYGVRDLWSKATGFKRAEFMQFIARFNPANQYVPVLKEGVDKKLMIKNLPESSYLFDEKQFIDSTRFCDPDSFVFVKDLSRLTVYLKDYKHLLYEIESKIKFDGESSKIVDTFQDKNNEIF